MPLSAATAVSQASRTKGGCFEGLAEAGKVEEEESNSVLFARWNEQQRICNAMLPPILLTIGSYSIDFCKLAYTFP